MMFEQCKLQDKTSYRNISRRW